MKTDELSNTIFRKYEVRFLILLIYSLSASASSFWQPGESSNGADRYTSTHQTRLTVRASESEADPSQINLQTLRKTHEMMRTSLARFGLTDWTVTDDRVTRRGGVTRLAMSGTYRDSSGQMTYWTELHYYRQGEKLQMLLTHTNRKALKKNSSASAVKAIREQYGF